MSDATGTGAGFDPKRSRWIPWIFVGGMLLVVAVNAVLVFASVSTFTGVLSRVGSPAGSVARARHSVMPSGRVATRKRFGPVASASCTVRLSGAGLSSTSVSAPASRVLFAIFSV